MYGWHCEICVQPAENGRSEATAFIRNVKIPSLSSTVLSAKYHELGLDMLTVKCPECRRQTSHITAATSPRLDQQTHRLFLS